MKLWVDDVRCPPVREPDWIWAVSVNDAKIAIRAYENGYQNDAIIIDLDHDAGDFADQGGDYIKLLDWLEVMDYVDATYSFHLHTMNPVGRDNMRAIIQKNDYETVPFMLRNRALCTGLPDLP